MSLQILEDIVNEYDARVEQTPIDRDTFLSWQRHSCTQRLRQECIRAALETMLDNEGDPLDDVELIALKQNYVRGMREAFSLVSNWKPEEIADDD